MNVCLLLLTYAPSVEHPRADYARKTLDAALTNLATRSSVKLHIAHDGSDLAHVAELVSRAELSGLSVSVTNAERGGYGRSYNLATQEIHQWADYVLPLEDDWVLTQRLDLDALIESMEASEGDLRCIRMGYLGWTHPIVGSIEKYGTQSFFLFDAELTAETHIWSGHPRLETVSFQRDVGAWPEGVDPGTTEIMVAQRKEARYGVGWPLDLRAAASQDWGNLFAHIGEVQARSDQQP